VRILLMSALVVIGAACTATELPVSANICQDSRVIEATEERAQSGEVFEGACKSFTMPYRENGRIVDVQIARLLSGFRYEGDAVGSRWEDVVLLPSGELIDLGYFIALEHNYPGARAYAHKAANIGEECPINSCSAPLLFEPVLEKRLRRLCITYDMRPPYTGSFAECADGEIFPGQIDVAEGAVVWPAAKDVVCKQILLDAGMDCAGDLGVTFRPELNVAPDGALMYFVDVDFTPVTRPSDCGSFIYRVYPAEARATWMAGIGCP
jgi:hypothetical protein